MAGDALIGVRVFSHGYSGSGGGWIEAAAIDDFARQLATLDVRREGKAELESLYPEELQLRLFITDLAGHCALSGSISQDSQTLNFAFSFCPSFLSTVCAWFSAMHQGRLEPAGGLTD